MFLTKDNLKLGLILGLLAPFAGMLAFYYWKFSAICPFKEFVQYLGKEKHLLTSMVTFSLLANAIVFTVYVNTNKDKTAKGIFITTCFYVIATLVLKFIY
jgi:hypothetical protein